MALAILAASVAATFVTTGIEIYRDRRNGLAAIDRQLDAVEAGYRQTLAEDIHQGRGHDALLALRGIVGQPGVHSVELLGGELLGGGLPPELPAKLTMGNTPRATLTRDVALVCDCGGIPQKLGTLRIVASLDTLYDELAEHVGATLLDEFMELAWVALFVFAVVQRTIGRHLLDLAGTVAEFMPGRSAPLRLKRREGARDELDELVAGFNRMGERIVRHADEAQTMHARLSAIFDSIPDLAWIKDPEGRLLVANRAFDCAARGAAPDQSSRDADAEVMRTARSMRSDEVRVRSDGSSAIFEVIRCPVLSADGTAAGIVGIERDVTERRASEEEARRTAGRLEMLISSVRAVVFQASCSADGPRTALRFLGSARTSSGHAPEFLNGLDIAGQREIVHPDDREWVFDTIGTHLAQDGGAERIIRVFGADGSLRSMLARERVIARHGNMLETEGLLIDISAELDAQRKVEAIIRNVPGLVFRMHYPPEGLKRILFADGHTPVPDFMIGGDGSAFAALFHPDDFQAAFVDLPKRLRAEGEALHLVRGRGGDGQWRWYRIWEKVVERDGDDIYTEGIVLDVTDEIHNRRLLEVVVSNMPVLVFRLRYTADGKKRIIFLDGGDVHEQGLSRRAMAEMSPDEFRDQFHPDDRDFVFGELAGQLRAEGQATFQARLRRPDGSYCWQRFHEKLVEIEGDEMVTEGMAIDVSREVVAKQRLENIVNGLPGGLFRNRYPSHGQKICQFFGNIPPALAHFNSGPQGEAFRAIFHPDEQAFLFDELPHILRETGNKEFMVRLRVDEVSWRHFRVWERVVERNGDEFVTEGVFIDVTEEVANRNRMEAIVSNLPGTVFRMLYPAAGGKRLLYVGGENTNHNGMTAAQLLAAPPEVFVKLYHPDDHEELFVRLPERLRREGMIIHEFRVLQPDGGYRWLRVWERVVERDGGDFITEGITFDVNDEIHAKLALQASARRYRELVDALPVGVLTVDAGGRTVLFNDALETVLGRPLESGIRPRWAEVGEAGSGGAALHDTIDRVLRQKGALRGVELSIGSGNGGQRDLLGYFSPSFDMAGNIAGEIAVLVDITSRKRAERALERVNRGLLILSAVNEALVHSDDEEMLFARVCEVLVETGGYRMAWIGLAEEDEAGTVRPIAHAGLEAGYLDTAPLSWRDGTDGGHPLGPCIRDGATQMVRDTAHEDMPAQWRSAALIRGYQSSLWLPLIDDSRTIGCLCVKAAERDAFDADEVHLLVDLASNLSYGISATRHRRWREEVERFLHQAQKMEALGQLAGSVAHDFNNLLGAILGFAKFIEEDTAPRDPVRRHAAHILSAANRGRALVGQILSFARKGALKNECFPIVPLMEEATALLRATIPATTQLSFEIAANDDDMVQGDDDQLTQVVLNLAINAHDALGGDAGAITIAVHPAQDEVAPLFLREQPGAELPPFHVWEDGDGTAHAVAGSLDPSRAYLALTVSDNGCGMDARILENIFAPFFTTKGLGRGTGLGLATVHGIVLAHGGGLLVRSRLGEGSVFEVLLPRATGKPPPPKPVPLCASARIAPGQASVLLVDDDPDFGEMMFKVLERHGYEVSPCSNPLEAIEALRSGDRWDAVIADQTMPGMTGIDLIREIAAEQPGVPCILCTGFAADSLDEDKLKAAGVSVLLRKPIDTDKLITIVDELVAAHLNADAPPAGGES